MRRFFLAPLVLAFALAGSIQAADTTPPTLISATRYSTNAAQVFVLFSEAMDTNSVLAITNYTLKTSSGTPARTINIVDSDIVGNTKAVTNIVLYTDVDVDLTRDWSLTAVRVADTNKNVIVTNANASVIPLTTIDTIIPRESEWYFRDDGFFINFAQYRFTDNSWAQPDYDYLDNFLPSHPAAFFVGIQTVPPNGNSTLCCYDGDTSTSHPSLTSYFIRDFVVNGSLFNSTYRLSAFIDSGAIIYINGKEAFRTNIAATVTQPTYFTLARGAGGLSWSAPRVLDLSPYIVPGSNHIAVEVHQTSTGDTTAGFGLELAQQYIARVTGPLAIVGQPSDLTNVVEGTTASFQVKPDGTAPITYQWSLISPDGKKTNTIAGATNRVLNIPLVPLSDDGAKVFVKVSGGTPKTNLTSTAALLKVVPDTIPPKLVSALYDEDAQGIVLTFSEVMKSGPLLTVANYNVTNLQGQPITVASVQDIDGASVLLKLNDPLTLANRYVVNPQNLSDNAGTANALPNNSAVTVGGSFTLIPYNSTWHYYQSGTNPPVDTNWISATYNETSDWLEGDALFYNTDSDLPALKVTQLNTQDSQGNTLITHYFRKQFPFSGTTNGVSLVMSHIIDDGAVMWLNGVSSYRFNMGTSTPKYTTAATGAIGDAFQTNDVAFPIKSLVSGVNQLGVEVHQNADNPDVAFAMELVANVASFVLTNLAPIGPTVAITAPAANATVSGTVAINATVTAASGTTISKVEFFDGTTKLGEDNASPYSFSWASSGAGVHTLRVVATDSKGGTGSSSVAVTVTVVETPPTLSIAFPSDKDHSSAKISWTGGTGYVLESSPSLSAPVWTSVPNGTTSPVTVTPGTSAGAKFYRLHKP